MVQLGVMAAAGLVALVVLIKFWKWVLILGVLAALAVFLLCASGVINC
jgi:hypothetical protein